MTNKRVVILGGGTFNYVRCHLALAAPAFGATAEIIADYAYDRFKNMDIDLNLTKMAEPSSDLITNEDVSKYVDELISDNTVKVIFFNVALTDYEGQIGDIESGKYAKRLKTSEGEVVMKLTPADKILGKIRKTRKDIFLVAFKTTCGATEEEMFASGLNLLKTNSCNLVFVNDVETRKNFIVTPEEGVYHCNRKDGLKKLVDMAYARSHLSFTKSTVVDGLLVPWDEDHIYPALMNVVEHCIQKSAYKVFKGVTTGHFAAKVGPNEFITSIRKTNFNDLDLHGMVRVKTDGEDRVVAMGAKPSVGGQSQRIVFEQFDDTDCIVHFHCPLKKDHPDNIQVMSQFEYECGSHECGQNTANGLTKHGNLYAVMLDNHGPNIVFHHDINPQEVIDFIERNFDLEKSTSGFEQVYFKKQYV